MIRGLSYFIGTGFGSGYIPVAPGTAGSIVAILLYYLFYINPLEWIVLTILFFVIGVWSATQIEKDIGKDPSIVVIDEIVGQWIALLFLPYSLTIVIGAFIFFRLFDILKPYPINKLENMKGGLGIMIDDVLAGIYANLVLQALLLIGILD